MATAIKPVTPVLNPSFLATGLVMALPMNENTGSALADISGNGNNATLNGTFAWETDSLMGRVVRLDGSTAYASLAAALATAFPSGAGSMSCWIKLDVASPPAGQQGLANIGGLAGGVATRTRWPNGSNQIESSIFRGLAKATIGLTSPALASWHLLGITTLQGGNYRVYLNGVLQGTVAAEGVSPVLTAPFEFGRSTDSGGSSYLDGVVGDVRLWSRELQSYEFLTIFNDPWGLYRYTPPAQIVPPYSIAVDKSAGGAGRPSVGEAILVLDAGHRGESGPSIGDFAVMLDLDTDGGPFNPGPLGGLDTDIDARNKPARTGTPTPTLNADAINTGLRFAIPFNDNTLTQTQALDYSPYGHHATVTAAHWSTDSLFTLNDRLNRVAFNATGVSGGGASIPRTVDLEPVGPNISLAAWVKFDTFSPAGAVIVGKRGSAGAGFAYALRTAASNAIVFEVKDTIDGTASLSAGTGWSVGVWYHVVGTYDGVNIRIYVDGVLRASTANGGALAHDTTAPVGIGRNSSGGDLLDGRIDDVRLWDRTLSAAEVESLVGPTRGKAGALATGVPAAWGAYLVRALVAPPLIAMVDAGAGVSGGAGVNDFAMILDVME